MMRGATVIDRIQAAPWTDKTKIFVIQSVPLLRRGIESALLETPAFSKMKVLAFASAEAAMSELLETKAGDVILSDMSSWSLLRPTGAGKAGEAYAFLSEKKVAFGLVTSVDPAAMRLFREQGVAGVMAPEAEPEALIQLVKALCEGRSFYPTAPKRGDVLASLSNRQFQILELMTRGLLNKQIAWELGLTEGTVKSHVSAILDKLGCDRRTQAITAYMKSTGLASAPVMAM